MSQSIMLASIMLFLSPLLGFIPIISQAFSTDPDYSYNIDGLTTCTPTHVEADRATYFTQVALWSFLICIILGNLNYIVPYTSELLRNGEFRDVANFVFVITSMLYSMALTVLATEFTFGMKCNSFDGTQSSTISGLLWAATFLWVFALALFHTAWTTPGGYLLVSS